MRYLRRGSFGEAAAALAVNGAERILDELLVDRMRGHWYTWRRYLSLDGIGASLCVLRELTFFTVALSVAGADGVDLSGDES